MNAASINYREISPGIFDRNPDQSEVPGVIPPPESREATQRVDAVATGSGWVSAGLLLRLAQCWESAAEERQESAGKAYDDHLYDFAATMGGRATAIAEAAKELRLLVEDTSVRQPTQNHTICNMPK